MLSHFLAVRKPKRVVQCGTKRIAPEGYEQEDQNFKLTYRWESLVFLWSSGSFRSPQSSQIMLGRLELRLGRLYENTTWTIANDPDDWDNPDCLVRIESYPDDWEDRINFEAIIWKHSYTSPTIGTIMEGYPRNYHSYFNWIGKIFGMDAAEGEKRNVRTANGRHLKKRKSVPSSSGRDAVSSWNL